MHAMKCIEDLTADWCLEIMKKKMLKMMKILKLLLKRPIECPKNSEYAIMTNNMQISCLVP